MESIIFLEAMEILNPCTRIKILLLVFSSIAAWDDFLKLCIPQSLIYTSHFILLLRKIMHVGRLMVHVKE